MKQQFEEVIEGVKYPNPDREPSDRCECGHCGAANSWYGINERANRKCYSCGKINDVWCYRLWVVQPIKAVEKTRTRDHIKRL